MCLFAQSQFTLRIIKNVVTVFGQRHIDVHTGTIDSEFWLWHKTCKQSVALCDCLHCKLKGHDVIRCHHSLIILKIDFMLCRCHFVVGSLDFKSHIFKGQYHVTSCIFAQVYRSEIKIACFFVCDRCRLSILILMEQEKLTLRSNIECVSHLSRFCDLLL